MIYTNDYRRLLNWPSFPLVRVAILLILGIYLGTLYPVAPLVSCSVFVSCLVAAKAFDMVKSNSIKYPRFSSVFILISFFLTGYVRVQLENKSHDSSHYIHESCVDCVISGQLINSIQQKENSQSALLMVSGVEDKPARGLLLVYFNKLDTVIDYSIGDRIAIRGTLSEISNSKNPLAFDYQSYMSYKGVERQIFVRAGHHGLQRRDRVFFINHYAFQIRQWAEGILRRRLSNDEHFATASAMVLGNREHISDELQSAFAETGAVHVLAVSGLHVGIIIMLFSLMMRRIGSHSTQNKKMAKFVVLVAVVTAYTFITGASPAVVRAALMFSALLFGRLWYNHTNIFNILAFSAILILIYDPYYLFHLGFLFSYLALSSIVFFQPIFLRWSESIYETKSALGYRIAQLATVSLAAQILIFPISVFYFHKFPIYFLLSGVFAVALAPVLLGAGLLLIICDGIPFLSDVLAVFLQVAMQFFLYGIRAIQSLPITSVDQIWISKTSMILMYIGIFAWMYILGRDRSPYQQFLNPYVGDRKNAVTIMFLSGMGLLLNSCWYDYKIANQSEMVIYDIQKGTMIDFTEGRMSYTLSSDSLEADQVMYASRDNRIYHAARKREELTIYTDTSLVNIDLHDGLLTYAGKSIYFAAVHEDSDSIVARSDMLYLSHSTKLRPYRILDVHETTTVVVDRSLSYRTINEWKKECAKRDIAFYNIGNDGPIYLVDMTK